MREVISFDCIYLSVTDFSVWEHDKQVIDETA